MSVTRLALVLTFGLSVAYGSTVDRPREFHITIPRHTEFTPVQKLNRDGVDAVLKRQYEKAEGLFFKAYLFDPADPFTLNNLGYVSELQGQVERAEKFYQLAQEQGCDAVIETSTSKDLKGKPMMDALGSVKNVPMRVNRINVLGMGLLAQGRGFEAVTVFKQALALDPKNPFTLNNLGVAITMRLPRHTPCSRLW
jgi:tetratricopeptide (TPR) repeat protein